MSDSSHLSTSATEPEEPPTTASRQTPQIAPGFEKRFVAYCIVFTILLAAMSGIMGFAMSRPDLQYVGAVYNIDDTTVYYSWVRQAADGHFFIRNLFTTDLQRPIQFNLLMLTLGQIVRITHLSIPVVFFVARIVAGGFLLSLIYRLFRLLAPSSPITRMSALFFCCLGSGFGWVFWPRWIDNNPAPPLSVDTWQPEAFTFQSIDMSALFTVSQILIVGIIFLLVVARRSGKVRYAVCAGICGLILANIHSYDILHVIAAWFAYLVVSGILAKRFDAGSWLQAVVCGLITMPSVVYQYFMYKYDPVFHIRVYDLTLSPALRFYLFGYGAVFILALAMVICWALKRFKDTDEQVDGLNSALLPICWFCAALLISYTPHVNFQRKMIMGADIPLSFLAGCGLAIIIARANGASRVLAVALCALLSLPTTFLFVYRDMRHLALNRSETLLNPFLTADEASALVWIRQNTAPDSAILGLPNFTVFVPGWCDRYTIVSQWGETPMYKQKLSDLLRVIQRDVPESALTQYLSSTKSDYFVFSNGLNGKTQIGPNGQVASFDDFNSYPDLLAPVYRNDELTIYKVLVLHGAK